MKVCVRVECSKLNFKINLLKIINIHSLYDSFLNSHVQAKQEPELDES